MISTTLNLSKPENSHWFCGFGSPPKPKPSRRNSHGNPIPTNFFTSYEATTCDRPNLTSGWRCPELKMWSFTTSQPSLPTVDSCRFRCHGWYMFWLRPLSHPKFSCGPFEQDILKANAIVLAGAPMFPKIPSCLPISWIFVGVISSHWGFGSYAICFCPRCLRWFSNAWERPNLEKEWSTLYLQIPFGMSNSTLNFNSYVDMDDFFASPAGKCWKPRSFNKRYCLSWHLMPMIWRGKGALSPNEVTLSLKISFF